MFDIIIKDSVTILSTEYTELKRLYYTNNNIKQLLDYIHSIKLYDSQIVILTLCSACFPNGRNPDMYIDLDIICPLECDNSEDIKSIWDKTDELNLSKQVTLLDWHDYKYRRIKNLMYELITDDFKKTRLPLYIKMEAL